jgi:hypothetical protein
VEKLGSMTPEQLEAIEGIDAEAVNRIQQAINSFYGQEYLEAPQDGAAPQESAASQESAPASETQAAPAETVVEEGVPEGIESSASDTMVEPAEFAEGAGAEGHSGAESIEDETTEP